MLVTAEENTLAHRSSAISSTASAYEGLDYLQDVGPRMTTNDLDILKLISAGISGKVYLARYKLNNELLALKVMPKKTKSAGKISPSVLAEQRIHSMLSETKEPWVVPLVASWHDRMNNYLAMEYIPGGDLAVELMKCRTFDAERAKFYTAEMVVALERLHSNLIIHRDVKPGNILLGVDGHLLLTDFGVSKFFSREDKTSVSPSMDCCSGYHDFTTFLTTEDCGTPLFMSPEQHAGKSYSFEVDWWGLAVTLYRMRTNRMPFGNDVIHNSQIPHCVAREELQFQEKDQLDGATIDFLSRMLAKDPKNRLSLKQIKEHSYFRGVDWNLLAKRACRPPTLPYIAPPPKDARSRIPVQEGKAYRLFRDPHPDFTWYTPVPRPRSAEQPTRKRPLKMTMEFLVCRQPSLANIRQALSKEERGEKRMDLQAMVVARSSGAGSLDDMEKGFGLDMEVKQKTPGFLGRLRMWMRRLFCLGSRSRERDLDGKGDTTCTDASMTK